MTALISPTPARLVKLAAQLRQNRPEEHAIEYYFTTWASFFPGDADLIALRCQFPHAISRGDLFKLGTSALADDELVRRFAMAAFNWGYGGYTEAHGIQRAFPFTLYLLSRFGGEYRPPSFYEDAFLKAFPRVLEEIEGLTFSTPEQKFRRCYADWSFRRFAAFFGLAEIELGEAPNALVSRPITGVRKKPLLDDAVRFHVPHDA